MLKKEQLEYRLSGNGIKPLFLAPDDPEALEQAEKLLSLYAEAAAEAWQLSRIEEMSALWLKEPGAPRYLAGMNKLILDRSVFLPARELDYPAFRKRCFLASAAVLKTGGNLRNLRDTLPEKEADLYGDLPGFERITEAPRLTPAELVDDYNMAQARGLICQAESLRLVLRDPQTGELRKVMKAVKFFRLLSRFSREKENGVSAEISGPFSLFGPTEKYGVMLSALLPVAAALKHWTLEAEITLKGKTRKLKLDEKSGLRSRSRAFSSFVPEEIRMYHKLFAEKSTLWRIVGNTPFFDAGEGEIFFPDLSFQKENEVVHLELFHRWHAGALKKRLALLHIRPELPLLIGIDRALAPDEAVWKALFADCPELEKRCWKFRDFPGVETTLRALEAFSAEFFRKEHPPR